MTELPAGTVTLVFTDIEGSTRLLAFLGSRYEAVLADHRKLLRDAFSSHHGVEVDTQGDAFFYAFGRAHDALAGALAAQRALASHPWPDDAELRVRIGIHTGEPTVTAEGYVGGDVHLGARICAATWGEQVLLSDATARLVADNQDASLRDIGEHTLKDIDAPMRLHQVVAPGLRSDFPPPRTASSHPTNLPPTLEPLVGRAEDISALTSLLSSSEIRVVTLTGPGGVGKTRLSLATGVELLPSFDDGVFFVDLSALSDPALVTGAIATALGVRESPGRSHSETLADYLSSRQVLLILDNLEHLLAATPDVSALVTSAPSLKVLVTSREPLRIAGEHEVPLAPLCLPSEDADRSEVVSSPAVELFVTRARALRPGFELTAEEASSVAAICRRLDGLPLAIELAAARTKVLSLSALASRLDQSLGALGQGRRDASTRQRTLRGAIEWSYDLLSLDEQALFRRLGVFAGGFTLEAAEAVCGRDPSLDVLDGIASLVDKSLVRAQEDRFAVLETIRSFAAEELEADPDCDRVRERHASFYLHLATADPEDRDHSLDREIDNFRSALEWWLRRAENGERKSGTHALQLATALGNFWYKHGHAVEGITWFKRALAAAPDPPPELHAAGLRGLGILVEATRELEGARQLFEEALDRFRTAGSQDGEAASLNSLGVVMRSLGDLDAAEEFLEDAIDLRRVMGDEAGLSTAISNLGITATDRGDFERAEGLFERALALDRKLKDEWAVTVDANNLAVVHLERGDYEQATKMFTQALRGFSKNGDLDGMAESLEISAGIAGATDDPVSAARLAGAADALRADAGLPLAPPDRRRFEHWMAEPRAALSTADFEQNWNEGVAMTPQQATSYALRGLPD